MALIDPHPEILLAAGSPIPLHALAALAALALGVRQFAARKGDRAHRLAGWAFIGLMLATAVTALGISTLRTWGYFSPIHLLVPVIFGSVFAGLRSVRRGDIRGHKRAMTLLVVLALIVPGVFTLMPGRVMHDVVFGPDGPWTPTPALESD